MPDSAADAAYAEFTELYQREEAFRKAEFGDQSMASLDRPLEPWLPDVSPAA